MKFQEIREGKRLFFITSHEEVACIAIANNAAKDDLGREYAKVCFLEAGAGYILGDIAWVALDDLREE